MHSLQAMFTAFPCVAYVLFGILGLLVGSFLNVVIFRTPRGKSVNSPASQCACGTPIPWYRNLPVIAWCIWGRSAPCCKQPYSIRYPAVELVTGALFVGAWHMLPLGQAIPVMVFISLCVVMTMIDWDTMYIPDWANIGSVILGVALAGLNPLAGGYIAGTVAAIIGVMVGTAICQWIYFMGSVVFRKEAMGSGDVILVAAFGAWFGWQGAVFSLFGGAIVGLLLILPMKFIKKDRSEFHRECTCKICEGCKAKHGIEDGGLGEEFPENAMPFGPSIIIAGLLYGLWLHGPMSPFFHKVVEIITTLSKA